VPEAFCARMGPESGPSLIRETTCDEGQLRTITDTDRTVQGLVCQVGSQAFSSYNDEVAPQRPRRRYRLPTRRLMSWPDTPGRPLRENLGMPGVNLPIDDALAGLASLDLVRDVVDHGLRGFIKPHLAEAVRTRLIHRLLPICCPRASDRGWSTAKRASDLGWS
jgi:hypothetical protein